VVQFNKSDIKTVSKSEAIQILELISTKSDCDILTSLISLGRNSDNTLDDGDLSKKVIQASKDIIKRTSGVVRKSNDTILTMLHETAQAYLSLESALEMGTEYLYNVQPGDDWRATVADVYRPFFSPKYHVPRDHIGLDKIESHLLISTLCNLSCISCKYSCSSEGEILHLDQAIDICDELKGFGSVRVLAEASGEPTMPQILDLIGGLRQHYKNDKDVRVVVGKMVTNGLLPAKTPQQTFERLHRLGTTDLGFSFYANPKIHDEITQTNGFFNQVLEGLDNLNRFNHSEKKIRKWVEIILTKGIKPDDIEFYFNLENVDGFQIVPLVPSGKAWSGWNRFALDLDEYRTLTEIFEEKRTGLPEGIVMRILNLGSSFLGPGIYNRIIARNGYCNAAKQRVFVNGITGEVYPCTFFAGYEGMALGNIYTPTESITENFKMILSDQQDKSYLRIQEFNNIQDQPATGLCNDCNHDSYCKGGCLAISYAYRLHEAMEKEEAPQPLEILQKAKEQQICRHGWNNNP